ncbi:13058_t:CDS:2, partial [Cetraspora pellucida]
MPKVSYRKQQIKSVTNILNILLKEHSTNTNKITSEIPDKEIDELFELLKVIELDWYLSYQITRVSKETFWHVENLIHDNSIFSNKSRHPQRPVWQQLAVTLERLSCASVGQFARQWGLGIGTVVEYTKHGITAINLIGNKYVQWSDSVERQQISNQMEQLSGFKRCVGFLDGTDVVLEYKLLIDGSVTDSRAYKSTSLFCETQKFFNKNEYLLADCGYPLTSTIIISYKQPQSNISENSFFNTMLSKKHVRIEHVNGIWKGRFGCLNGIRTQILFKKDLKFILNIIKAMIILYNLALKNNNILKKNLNEIDLNSTNTDNFIDNSSNKEEKKIRKYIQNL